MSSAVSSTSSNSTDQRTFDSWWAPTTESPAIDSANSRSDADGLRRDSAGTRTSKPAASSWVPVTVISSHASSWLRYTWPRRSAPGRSSAGNTRSSRASSSASAETALPSARACSIGRSLPLAPGPRTERNHAPPESGGSSETTSLTRAVVVSGLAHRSMRSETSPAAATGAVNVEPSSRVTKASPTSAIVRASGGGAAKSSMPAAWRTMVSTTAPWTERVTLRGSAGAMAVTGRGMPSAIVATAASSTSAGRHVTDRSMAWPSRRLTPDRVGTTAPRATRRTASMATRPSHATLAPTPSRPRPPPTATSQPSASPTGIDSAAALAPSGRVTSRCRLQPSAGPPMASSRSDSSSADSGATPGPAAHTTIWPLAHDACSRTSPTGSAAAMAATGSSVGEQEVVGRVELGELGLEVGDDLGALGPTQLPHGGQAVLGVVEEVLEDVAPPGRVGLEQMELVRRGAAVGGRPCGFDERFGECQASMAGAPCAVAPGRAVGEPGRCRGSGPPGSGRHRVARSRRGCLFTDPGAACRGFVSAISPDGYRCCRRGETLFGGCGP